MEELEPGAPEQERAAGPPQQEIDEKRPIGALLVVGLLLVTIVVMWFSIYFLDRVRA